MDFYVENISRYAALKKIIFGLLELNCFDYQLDLRFSKHVLLVEKNSISSDVGDAKDNIDKWPTFIGKYAYI